MRENNSRQNAHAGTQTKAYFANFLTKEKFATASDDRKPISSTSANRLSRHFENYVCFPPPPTLFQRQMSLGPFPWRHRYIYLGTHRTCALVLLSLRKREKVQLPDRLHKPTNENLNITCGESKWEYACA
jgi:hypothetical protein